MCISSESCHVVDIRCLQMVFYYLRHTEICWKKILSFICLSISWLQGSCSFDFIRADSRFAPSQ